MKRALPILLAVGIGAGALIPNALAAPLNGSFESSTFSGWQLDISTGLSAWHRGYRPAGTARVVSSWEQPFGPHSVRAAREGNRFAMLATLAAGNFTGQGSYDISLHQELTLAAGSILSGWSFFFNGDTETQDSAWVKVLDDAGATVAAPWLQHSGCEPMSGFRDATPWTQWSWQAPEDGNYTLSFGMTTAGDNNSASYGFFDGVLVTPASLPVPEPSALTLVTLGTGLLLRYRRRTRTGNQI